MRGDDCVKLKYPVKKYILPWSLLAINIFTLIMLGNHLFLAMALVTTFVLYGVLKLTTKQIEKKDKEIEALKKSILLDHNQM